MSHRQRAVRGTPSGLPAGRGPSVASALPPLDLAAAVVGAWSTSHRATVLLIENVPPAAWAVPAPGLPRRSIRLIGAHLHNSRCGWIKTLGAPHGIAVPERVDKRTVTRRELAAALNRSSRAMVELLELGGKHGGRIPPTPVYVWRNLPLDIGHVLAYFVAHEGHHRGQIVMLARQLGHPLPPAATGGIWHFTRLSKQPRDRSR
ncbi:MAG: DinB family protein [Syntrophomonadaceae bacterium]